MSLLSQIYSVRRLRQSVPMCVKSLTYERLYQQFEPARDGPGNRYRNPVARVYDRILSVCRRIVRRLGRIEIVVRIKPD
jgi:hypothetical protein